MKTLDEIGLHHNAEKASTFRDSRDATLKIGSEFLKQYEREMFPLRHSPVLLMELGVGYGVDAGNSLRVWDEYFTHRDARIVGVDIVADHRRFANERIDIEIGDSGDREFLTYLSTKYPDTDVIIDDASHYWVHQLAAFKALFCCLKPGGTYILEDIGTSFGDRIRSVYGAPGGPDAYAAMLVYINRLVGHGSPHPLDEFLPKEVMDDALFAQIDGVVMIRGAVIIRKRGHGVTAC